ncbi:MAG: PPE family protein [Mycobacterium sp.]|nr:PPE family protein [Mycobacterium sp.]
MTAPVWMAFPPEVHSTLLSGGPGPGPLLAAADAWNSLSAEYGSAASELTAILEEVQAGRWSGPSAAQYVAAHTPYLAWLLQASADSAGMAAQQAAAATAYTTALAAMPTLPELAANHAMHAVLVATNFFGINTIPIAANEADYARMWVQAATTMSTYQAVSSAAVAASPRTAVAPQVMKMDMSMNPGPGMRGGNPYIMGTALPQNLQEWLQALFPFNPFSPQGWSMHPSLSMFLSRAETLIPMYAHNPAQLFETIVMLALQFVIHRTLVLINLLLFNSAGLLSFFLSNPVYTLALVSPLLALPAAAAGGLAGLAGLAADPTTASLPVPAMPIPVTSAPPMPTVSTAPAVGPAPLHAPAAMPSATPATATASAVPPQPPTVVGPEGAMGTQAVISPYLAGVLQTGSESRAAGKTQRPAPDAATTATAPAAPVAAQRQARRRRRTAPQRTDRGYRYEFLASEPDTAVRDGAVPTAASMASGQAAGPLGFAGTAPNADSPRAAGLTSLAGDGFGGGPTVPMVPGSGPPDLN